MTKVYYLIAFILVVFFSVMGAYIIGVIKGRTDNEPSEDHAQTRYQLGEEMRKEIKSERNQQIFNNH